MAPWQEAVWTLARVLGLAAGVMTIGALVLVVLLDVWVKRASVGKFCCFFLQQRHVFSRLLKEDSGNVYLGRSADKEKYHLSPEKQFWVWWPGGLPHVLQVPVRAHWYVRYNPEPWDPEEAETLITSKSLQIITDEAMLKTAWKDVRDATHGRVGAGALPQWAIIAIIVAATLSGATLYFAMQLQRDVQTLLNAFGG